MKLRALALALLALPVLLVPAPARADVDPCADHDVSVGYVPVLRGSVCHDGAVYVCTPRNKQGDFNCREISWCTFCPGPVLVGDSSADGFPVCHDKDVTIAGIEHVHVGVDCYPGVWADTCVPTVGCRHDDPRDLLS